MGTARNYNELQKLLAEQFAKKIEKKFKDGEVKRYCSVCECEQVLKLDGTKPKCTVCDKEFELDIEYK
ncbi:hypothetical protein [Tissierella pigra]|uniref:Uncharacterized protein n=1 Tax=Tissierella pigra TaxID=2607614 RepID=A0A6N7XVV4_9FIRM|nr:hypothetical protein [Tissierella pigra]MSU01917.1 hypothetical protein [Tissierella pigra]